MRHAIPPTLANIVAALGYTPANRAGDTFTGAVNASTTLAVGGFTIGTRAFGVTGTSEFSDVVFFSQGLKGRNVNSYLFLDVVAGQGTFSTGNNGTGNGIRLDYAAADTLKILSLDGATSAIVQAGTLALGGATIGANALAVTGTTLLNTSLGIGSSGQILFGDAANTISQRNSTTAQTFHIHNTYTDASNYERLTLAWAANVLTIKAIAAGTGSVRDISFGSINTLLSRSGSSSGGGLNLAFAAMGGSGQFGVLVSGTHQASSGVTGSLNVQPTINQSSTAGYTIIDANPTETAIGSGSNLLYRGHIGAGADVFSVDRTGIIIAAGQVRGSTTKVTVTTVASLPTAASNAGAVSQVNDASTTLVLGLGGIVAGGGANFAPVWCDGTNWRYG